MSARLAAVGGLRPLAARAVARARRIPARPRRRDGAAQRPRPLHPPQEGVSLWVVPVGARSSPPARTSRTRSSTRPPTRSTGTRRSTTSPRGWSTCDRPRSSTTSSASPTTPWSPRSGWAGGSAARPSSRRTSRSPTSASTSSARRARCWPTPATSRATAATEDDLAYLRDDRDFRNVWLVERPQTDFGVDHGPAAGLRDLAVRALRRARAVSTDADAGRGRGQGGQGGRLPPRPRRATGSLRLGDGTDESHRRMQAALDAEWPYVEELFAPGRRRRSCEPASPSTRPRCGPPCSTGSRRCWPRRR